MEPKKIALLVGALLIAAMAAVMAKNMFGQSAAPAAQATVIAAPVGPEVLVATRMLPVGTIIQPDSFRYQPWPKDLVENAYYIKGSADPATLAGTVVRADITAGQPLTQGSLVKPGDRGFLAAALGAGMRAVTVAVSNQTGVAGFIFPGDRVDLVLTQSVAGGQGPELKASETFIRNVRILATDQKVVPDEDDKGNKKVAVAQSVTLEVTPRLAEKIAVAQTIGQLSLSLRSIADNNAELDRAIASGAVSLPQDGDPKTTAAIMTRAAQRPQDSNTSYVTGADVSRFQRRTVPTQTGGGAGNLAPLNQAPGGTAMGAMTSAMMIRALPQGPIVRVARGNNVTDVQLGGN